MNPVLDNIQQKYVINKSMDKLLKNNDIFIRKIIYEYLEDKCIHCQSNVVNPYPINDKTVCQWCIHKYIFCGKKDCSRMIYNPVFQTRCKYCLSWHCPKHKHEKCCRGEFFEKARKILFR